MILRKKKAPKMGLRERPQIRCEGHLSWVRRHVCAIEGKPNLDRDGEPHRCGGKTEAAHARTGTDGAMSVKPSDTWALPLCADAHKEQHRIGEPAFERRYKVNMKAIARKYAAKSPHRHKWSAQ